MLGAVTSGLIRNEADFVPCSERHMWRCWRAKQDAKAPRTKGPALTPEQQAYVWRFRGQMKAAWDAASKHGVFAKGYRTFLRHFHRLPKAIQEGISKSEKAMRAQLPFLDLPRPTHRMEVAEIDHALLDKIVIRDPVSGRHGHPWITVIIDVYSRKILGFSVTLAVGAKGELLGATSESAFAALADAILAYGKFEYLRFDQGADFMYPVANAIERLGIKPWPSPAYSPWTKPFIERWFKTLKYDLLPSCPGFGIALEEAA
jgi:transposase InsO family protein